MHVYICTCTERRHASINPNATLSAPTSVHAERVETCALILLPIIEESTVLGHLRISQIDANMQT